MIQRSIFNFDITFEILILISTHIYLEIIRIWWNKISFDTCPYGAKIVVVLFHNYVYKIRSVVSNLPEEVKYYVFIVEIVHKFHLSIVILCN